MNSAILFQGAPSVMSLGVKSALRVFNAGMIDLPKFEKRRPKLALVLSTILILILICSPVKSDAVYCTCLVFVEK